MCCIPLKRDLFYFKNSSTSIILVNSTPVNSEVVLFYIKAAQQVLVSIFFPIPSERYSLASERGKILSLDRVAFVFITKG